MGLRYILLEGNQVRFDFLSFYFLTFLCKRKYTCIWGRISLLLVKQIMSPFPFCEFNSVEVWLDLERGRKEMTDYLLFYFILFFFFQAVVSSFSDSSRTHKDVFSVRFGAILQFRDTSWALAEVISIIERHSFTSLSTTVNNFTLRS